MVIDTLKHAERYCVLGEHFQKAFEFLRNNDIENLPLGRHEIDGSSVFILVQEYTSKTIDHCGLEAHRVYADVHYVRRGFEYLGYAPAERGSEPVTAYDETADALFYEKECQYFLLQEGDIAIVFPGELHMPQKRALVPSPVRKACIKVRMA